MSFLPLQTAMTVLTLSDPATLTPRLGGWHRLEITSDVNSYLRVAMNELDLQFPTVTSGFRLTITSGTNALAATDINLFAASAPVAKAWSNTATEIARAINAAIGAGTVTCTWSGSTTGGTTGVFVITAPGASAITVAAHSTGWSMASQLFGGTTDQDAVATTWTGAAPRDLTRTGPGWIGAVLKGGLSYTAGMPYATSATPMRDAVGSLLTTDARRMCMLRAQEGYIQPGGVLQGHNQMGLYIADRTDAPTANARGFEQQFADSAVTRQPTMMSLVGGVYNPGSLLNTGGRTRVELVVPIIGVDGTRTVPSSIATSYIEGTMTGAAVTTQVIGYTAASNALYPLITFRRDAAGQTGDAETRHRMAYTISTGVAVEQVP